MTSRRFPLAMLILLLLMAGGDFLYGRLAWRDSQIQYASVSVEAVAQSYVNGGGSCSPQCRVGINVVYSPNYRGVNHAVVEVPYRNRSPFGRSYQFPSYPELYSKFQVYLDPSNPHFGELPGKILYPWSTLFLILAAEAALTISLWVGRIHALQKAQDRSLIRAPISESFSIETMEPLDNEGEGFAHSS